MRGLQLLARALGAVLLALGARAISDDPSVTVGVTAAVIAALLLACLSLLHRGRRLERHTLEASDELVS